jgi:hypothetical protein
MTTTRIIAAVWLSAAVCRAGETGQKITVCTQFAAADRRPIGPLARHLAGRMFAGVGVDVEWVDGVEALPGAILIVLSGGTNPNVRPGVLAYAEPHEGGRIRVFLDRVETYDDPAIVLAHVLVHEITHVIQGMPRHSQTGVMKAHWNGRDYVDMRHKPLDFTPEDLDLIRQGLPIAVLSNDHIATNQLKGVTR